MRMKSIGLPVDSGGLAVAKVSSSSTDGLGTTPLLNDSSEKDGIEATLTSSALLG